MFSGNSRRGYGRLPPEDPDDVANLNTQTSTDACSPNSSTASTPTAPNAPTHLAPEFCDLDLGDDLTDDSDYGEFSLSLSFLIIVILIYFPF